MGSHSDHKIMIKTYYVSIPCTFYIKICQILDKKLRNFSKCPLCLFGTLLYSFNHDTKIAMDGYLGWMVFKIFPQQSTMVRDIKIKS